jgi:hypothetical protein
MSNETVEAYSMQTWSIQWTSVEDGDKAYIALTGHTQSGQQKYIKMTAMTTILQWPNRLVNVSILKNMIISTWTDIIINPDYIPYNLRRKKHKSNVIFHSAVEDGLRRDAIASKLGMLVRIVPLITRLVVPSLASVFLTISHEFLRSTLGLFHRWRGLSLQNCAIYNWPWSTCCARVSNGLGCWQASRCLWRGFSRQNLLYNIRPTVLIAVLVHGIKWQTPVKQNVRAKRKSTKLDSDEVYITDHLTYDLIQLTSYFIHSVRLNVQSP